MSRAAILKTPTNYGQRNSKDPEEYDGDNHRNHPGNVLSGSSDGEPRRWQGENDGEQVDVAGCV